MRLNPLPHLLRQLPALRRDLCFVQKQQLPVFHQHLAGGNRRRQHRRLEAEEDVPGQVTCGERRGRMIIHEDDVGKRAEGEHAERGLREELISQHCIIGHSYLRDGVAPRPARVAVRGFVIEIRRLPLLPHRVGETVVAEADFHAEAQQPFHVRRADGVVHVRTRLVGHPSGGFRQQLRLAGVDVDGMSH